MRSYCLIFLTGSFDEEAFLAYSKYIPLIMHIRELGNGDKRSYSVQYTAFCIIG